MSNDIPKKLSDSANLTRALQAGIYAALLKHKQAGQSVCEWRNNKVTWISPERIPTDSKEDISKNQERKSGS